MRKFSYVTGAALIIIVIFVACGGADGGGESVVRPTEQPTDVPPTPTPEFGSVAYDVPKRMIREEEVQVILLVSPSEDDNLVLELEHELEEVGQQPGNVVTATVGVAKRMSATLAGAPDSAFEIVPLQAHDEQRIFDDKPTQWEWTVVPKEGGTHKLILRIERLVEMEGVIEHLKEEVYRDNVTIEVPFQLRVKDATTGLWEFKFWFGVLVIPFLFYWLKKRDKNDITDRPKYTQDSGEESVEEARRMAEERKMENNE